MARSRWPESSADAQQVVEVGVPSAVGLKRQQQLVGLGGLLLLEQSLGAVEGLIRKRGKAQDRQNQAKDDSCD